VKKKRLTFAEYLAAEEADPERRAQRRAREEADRQWLAIRMAEVRRGEAPIVADLQTNGVSVSQVSDLVNTAEPYPDAIPILWKHFLLSYSDRTKESIGRALAVREARYLWPNVVAEYRSDRHGESAKTGLAVALNVLTTPNRIDELIELARDQSLGDSRAMLLPALRRSRNPKAKAALIDLAADPQLRTYVEQMLKNNL